MSDETSATVIQLAAAQEALRDHFVGWQCRLRQLSVRQAGGRPTTGMRPAVALPGEDEAAGRLTVLIVQREPAKATAEFRHMARRTHDPAERYNSVLKFLAAAYYQHPQDFAEELTALFGPESELARRLLAEGRCTLYFEQYAQRYALPCRMRGLQEAEPAYQATYWHNSLFNPDLPAGLRILGFRPDWAHAQADPPAG